MSNQEALSQLANLFPNLNAGAIADAYESAGSLEDAVERLLVVSSEANIKKEADDAEQEAIRQEQIALDERVAAEVAQLEIQAGTPDESFVMMPEDENSAEELEAELEGRTEEAARLQAELESRVLENPGKVERAFQEFQRVFTDLKAKGDVNATKLMNHLKEALAMIDTTLRSVRSKLAAVGGKVKDHVASWEILEKLKAFAASLRGEVTTAIRKLRGTEASTEQDQQELEDYLANLDQRETELEEMTAA